MMANEIVTSDVTSLMVPVCDPATVPADAINVIISRPFESCACKSVGFPIDSKSICIPAAMASLAQVPLNLHWALGKFFKYTFTGTSPCRGTMAG